MRSATFPADGFLARNRAATAVLLFLLAIAPGAVAWHRNGVPAPTNSDEFSYLFQARTFASGRFANPPVDPAAFGAMFLLTTPKFAVKFQPGQGLLLAAGKVLAGNEYAGVLFSVGMLTVALWWMAQAFAPLRYALVIGVFAALRFGLFHDWSTSYWGGALPCTGAALALGAWARCRERWSSRPAALLAAGASILMLTRPFEGSLLIACLLLHLGWTFLTEWRRGQRPSLAPVAAFTAVMAVTGIFQGVYDFAVTGRAGLMPYVEYSNRYQQTPIFWLLQPPPPKSFPNEHLRLAHTVFEMATYRGILDRSGAGRVKFLVSRFRRSLAASLPSWAMPLLLVAALAWRDRLIRLLALFAVFMGSVLFCETWLFPHYLAGILPVFIALIARGCHLAGKQLGWPRATLALCAVALIVPSLRWAPASYRGPYSERIQLTGDDAYALRARTERRLTSLGGRHLVFVQYDYNRAGLDWNYNDPIPQESAIVWTRAMDPEAARALRAQFPGRTCWQFDARVRPADLVPCP